MLHIYEVLKRPIVTEKSTYLSNELGQYVFEVDERANKHQVKEAIETIFDVDVVDVNVMIVAPKRARRRNRRIAIRRSAWKKAIVTLAEGQRLQLFEGV
jgi:large subunit ribosomal protein L23